MNTKELILSMLLENTGIHMMDSGGGEGRHWQQNAKIDLTKQSPVTLDFNPPCKSDEIEITVNLYHYLPSILELDKQCELFNKKFEIMADWESDIYGVSKEARQWLRNHQFEVGESWNSYNGDSNLSQTLQGTELKRDGVGYGDYVLLQIHGGADVRGGYTDAKMFKYQKFQEFINPVPHVYAELKRGNEIINLEMSENGYGLVNDNMEAIDILEGDIITASL